MVKRYFEVVKDEFRKHGNVEIKLPVRIKGQQGMIS